MTIFNNIAFGNSGFDIATFDDSMAGARLAQQSIRIAANLVGSEARAGASTKGEFPLVFATRGERPIIADPMFSNPEAGDFRLRLGSPAIGAGLAGQRAGSSTDLGAAAAAGVH